MVKENNIEQELLRQMKTNSSIDDQKILQAIISKDMVRVRRMKKVTALSWLLVVLSFIVAGIIEALPGRHPTWFPPTAIIVVQALFIIAVSFTFSLYIRSRTLTLHQIQARLANIEAQLKKLSRE